MFCYKCGCELNSGPKCPNCGTDVQQYKRIIYTSNYLYNEGLAKAQVKDLSGAIIALKDAIWYNKNNLDARNLLGLCYYEIGETVAAFSEWIIAKNINDSGMQIKNNLADHYIQEVQSGKQLLDNMNTAIQRYNHALECCQSDNLDVAVLQLRKVLNLNSHYLRARQLLSLVYIEQQQWSKAQKELRKCLLLDINNTTTLRYLQEVESKLSPESENGAGKGKGKKRKAGTASGTAVTRIGLGKGGARKQNPRPEGGVIKYMADNETIIQPAGTRIPGVDGFGIPGAAVGGVIGLLVGAILVTFLVMPSRVAKVRSDAATQVREVSAQIDSKEAEIADLESQIEELQSSGASGGDLSAGDEAQVNALLAAASAYLADSSNEDGSVTTAFAQIDHANVSSLSEAYQTLYNTIKSAVGSDMLDYYYLAGSKAYEAASPDYETTITNLEDALLFDSETSPSAAHAQMLYYLGDSYYRGYLQSLNAASDDASTAASSGDTQDAATEDGSTASGATSAAPQVAASKDDYIAKAETYLGQVVNNYADSSYAARAWSDINAIAADETLAALAGDALIDANTDAAVTTSDTVDSTVTGADTSTTATTVAPDPTPAASTTSSTSNAAASNTGAQTSSQNTAQTSAVTETSATQETAATTTDTAAQETTDTSAADAEALAAATAAAQAAYAAAINSGASEADAMAAANAAIGN